MSSLQEEDFFDGLPDPLLLLIFIKLKDAKSLIRCLSVSRRFASLVFQTDTVFLSISPHKPNSKSSHGLRINILRNIFFKLIAKPLQFFHHRIAPNKSPARNSGNLSYYSPSEVLKRFKDVQSLHIEVPSHVRKMGLEGNGSLLKWKAEFDAELKNCVVLGATSFQKSKHHSQNQREDIVERVLTDDELKLRVVWTISCLLDASARHWLLKEILSKHHRLENVTISDVNKQGKIYVGKDQICEMRNAVKLPEIGSSSERSRVPDLSMKLWYVPVLELPETGFLMKGATLVVIRPVDGEIRNNHNHGDLVGFDGDESEKKTFDEAVREMMKMRNNYVMTMSSF
ncbi:F-box protein At4g18380 [Manihot esculenta]|uniref:F-box domain-containing protein n=1 Tax=Manihot esculenta TaxID=3983 RepID=A0A2C9WG34_MANES|nr:F-box protein At4g18380 [Manihot esculenta]OAY57997.1 hypothetical protein MANES_02G141400v8 [Manihot esculenta]